MLLFFTAIGFIIEKVIFFDIIDNYYNGYLFDDESDLLSRLFKITMLSEKEYLRLSENAIFTTTQLKQIARKNLIKEFSTYE